MGKHKNDQWTLTIVTVHQKGDRPEKTVVRSDSEAIARRRFGELYKVLGTDWYRLRAWIKPPKGKGRKIKLV